MIDAVIERCAGIDVGKRFLVVCVMTGPLDAEPKTEIRKFGTIVAELERLRDWLMAERCSHAVMESTGSYWKPSVQHSGRRHPGHSGERLRCAKPARSQDRRQR